MIVWNFGIQINVDLPIALKPDPEFQALIDSLPDQYDPDAWEFVLYKIDLETNFATG